MLKRKSGILRGLVRGAAFGAVATGVVTPLVRRRLGLKPLQVLTAMAAAPTALTIALPRSKKRDVAIYALQMWAFLSAHELPNDDPDKLAHRVRIDYPIFCDRALGLGELPTVRMQPPSNPGHLKKIDLALTWVHWLWYLFPHSVVIYTLLYKRKHFSRTAVMIAAVFDLGAGIYWLVPTAPPWWAAEQGKVPPIRRIMVEVGRRTWGKAWRPAYEFLGGNPVAAMPSLHFATSVMAAHMLVETGPIAGTIGWSYALTLGYGLVYLGEHYVVDLLVGLGLTEAVRLYGPKLAPALQRVASAVEALGKRTRG